MKTAPNAAQPDRLQAALAGTRSAARSGGRLASTLGGGNAFFVTTEEKET